MINLPITSNYREMVALTLINRISQIESIKAIEAEFTEDRGYKPLNISNWTTNASFDDEILKTFRPPSLESPIDYIYTYSLNKDTVAQLNQKLLGSNPSELTNVFMPNTTMAIVNIVNLLKLYDYQRICIVNPAYFSIKNALKAYGFEFDEISVERMNGECQIPYDKIIEGHFDAVWITSPIFSTSKYYSKEEQAKISALSKSGILVITDESFALPGHEILRELGPVENVIGIYSPHKAICVNSFKFSVVVCNKKFEDVFLQWVDVIAGNLPGSCCSAIEHFISKNYDDCFNAYTSFMTNAREALNESISFRTDLVCDTSELGSLYTLMHFEKSLPRTIDLDFMRDLIFSTGASLYPGALNGFDERFGFCYRVNLGLYNSVFISKLSSVLEFIDEVSRS